MKLNTDTQLHTFVDGIVEAQLPQGWKLLNINCNNGFSDPNKHVGDFVTQMNLFTNDDAIMYRVFSTTLKGVMLHWYTRLPRNSIDSFTMLIACFGA
ncbi:hypothetical protein HKD37_01G001618 [Glycine soja]